MSELDWLEREEKYRSRFLRTFLGISVVVAVALGVGSWRLQRQLKRAQEAEAHAAESAAHAEVARLRALVEADSAAAAGRVAAFHDKYGAQRLEGAPILLVPLPHNASIARFLDEVWSGFTHAVDPQVTAEKQREWFGQYYVDAMNMAWYNAAGHVAWQGEMQPQALLLPSIRQKGKELEIEKPTFPQIVRGQETVGLRLAEVPMDTTAAGIIPVAPQAQPETAPQEDQEVPPQESPSQGEAPQTTPPADAKPQDASPPTPPQGTKPPQAAPQDAKPGRL